MAINMLPSKVLVGWQGTESYFEASNRDDCLSSAECNMNNHIVEHEKYS
jgi:hypothetical protein